MILVGKSIYGLRFPISGLVMEMLLYESRVPNMYPRIIIMSPCVMDGWMKSGIFAKVSGNMSSLVVMLNLSTLWLEGTTYELTWV